MTTTKLKGSPVQLAGKLPAVGDAAPDFQIVLDNLTSVSLSHFSGKIKVILALPSLDTPVCQTETRTFAQKFGEHQNVVLLVVSGDLPFAMKRFCATEGLKNVINGSQFRDMNFSKSYGTHVAEGPFTGLSARAVFVVDQNDKIAYVELVPDIAEEPKYDPVLEAVQKL